MIDRVASARRAGLSRVVLALLFAAALAVLAAPHLARAQEEGGSTYLTPFPPNDVYRLLVIGDSMAETMTAGLAEGLGSDARVQVNKKHRNVQGLLKIDIDEELKTLDSELARDRPHIAVVLLGVNDRFPARSASGKRITLGSDEWKDEYGRRIDLVMKSLKRRNAAVYWAGLPPMRRAEINDDARMINELIRERAYLNGVRYIDVYVGFSDEDGDYSQWANDITGKSRNLRASDGIYFTWPGYQKLAFLVEEEVKRDISLAKAARNVALAGGESEQAKIRPKAAAAAAPVVPGKPGPATAKDAKWQASVLPPAAQARAAGIADAGADNSRITVRVAGAGTREETVAVDILRPAIPAAIIALVTRREAQDSAGQQFGESAASMLGGLAVIETITPGAESPAGAQGKRRAISTQSPYFRAVIKGERLPPRPGRADDFAWPRPEPRAAPPVPQPAALKGGEARPQPVVAPKGRAAQPK